MPGSPWLRPSSKRAAARGLLRCGEGADLAGQAALVSGGGVVVDDTLPGGLVDLADGLGQEFPGGLGVTRRDEGAELLYPGLELREIPAIAFPALLPLPHLF